MRCCRPRHLPTCAAHGWPTGFGGQRLRLWKDARSTVQSLVRILGHRAAMGCRVEPTLEALIQVRRAGDERGGTSVSSFFVVPSHCFCFAEMCALLPSRRALPPLVSLSLRSDLCVPSCGACAALVWCCASKVPAIAIKPTLHCRTFEIDLKRDFEGGVKQLSTASARDVLKIQNEIGHRLKVRPSLHTPQRNSGHRSLCPANCRMRSGRGAEGGPPAHRGCGFSRASCASVVA